MKRYNNLYNKICSMDNLILAHEKARKGKSFYKEVQMVNEDTDYFLSLIQEMLLNKSFKNSKYEKIVRKTDNGKIREILKLPYFPDRIIHHAIMNIVEPIWFKTLIRDTYSSIKGRGIHDGVNRLKKALRDKEGTKYCLKIDIEKFYPSIDNDILKKIIRKKIKDLDLLWLLDLIIDSTKGVPIGNYLSQYFANIFLNPLDHWLKEEKKVKYYYRYCDDLVILSNDKNYLSNLFREIKAYLVNYKLRIKKNWQIFPTKIRGIDFLGYRFFGDFTLVRKSISKRMISKISMIKKNWESLSEIEIISSIMSYLGWLKFANSRTLMNKLIDGNLLFIINEVSIKKGINNPLRVV